MKHGEDFRSFSDEELLREASGGNREAFGEFCVRSLPMLLRYARYHCAARNVPRDLAPEFCNEALLRALRHAALRSVPRAPQAWFQRIVLNCIRDWQRKNQRLEFIDPFDFGAAPPDSDSEERREELLKFFRWVTDSERDVLELRLIEELDAGEISRRLGISVDAVYKRYERAISKLRDMLVEHGSWKPIANS
jgi:RNA polymerase sigma factor (sigma-70 family)